MRVVGISTYDAIGGAGKAAYRLHCGLRQSGMDAVMIVQNKGSNNATVYGPGSLREKVMARIRPHLDLWPLHLYREREHAPFTVGWAPHRIRSQIDAMAPDVVQVHWVNAGFIPISALGRLGYPMVWTLHDAWAFTGGCHLPAECTRYRHTCGMCPVLGSNEAHDLSERIWRRKRRAWAKNRWIIVAPSRWMAERAAASSLFVETRIEIIPNGVDLARFKPIDQRAARDILGLPQDKRLILFGVGGDINDPNKGMELLKHALIELRQAQRAEEVWLLVIGAGRPDALADTGIAMRHLGQFQDELSLALLYASADVVVVPSRQENLPNMVMEAAACARPVVAFRIGGMPDLIEDRVSGYLAMPYDPADFAKGIAWTLETPRRRAGIGIEARRKTEAEFDIRRVAARYSSLYQELIAQASVPVP